MKIGIIGGSGLSESKVSENSIYLETPYGKPSAAYEIEYFADKEIIFLRRHGEHHSIPPHRVNYKANIFGFKELSVERIIGVFAVGSLDEKISPGMIVIPDQLIDFTQGARENTFYNGPKVVHIDFTTPFCNELRNLIIKASKILGIETLNEGTYVCVNGPRLETAAEIRFFKNIGGHIIGMTLMPEASLARELALCYTAICVVVNFAAGISKTSLTIREVIEVMNHTKDDIRRLIKETIKIIPIERNCHCKNALEESSF